MFWRLHDVFLHFRDRQAFYINIPMNATLASLSNFVYTRFKITPVSHKKSTVSCEMRAADTNYRTQTERRRLRLLVISVKLIIVLSFLLYTNNIQCAHLLGGII